MKLPAPAQYRDAIQNPSVAFSRLPELANTTAETTRNGMPAVYAGNFTVTFHLLGGGREWAVRCYFREISFATERYDAITKFLEGRPDPAFAFARLVPRGILVHDTYFDIIQMEWINGRRLNDYIDELIEDETGSQYLAERLANLAEGILNLGLRLEQLGIAHGDIQHGNVLVDGSGELRLVDYDDMFLPELAYLHYASGIGQENFQHPRRRSDNFDEKLDRFPFISIYVTLRALCERSSLWQTYNAGEERLLFRKADFVDPTVSKLFQALDGIDDIKELVDRFASICMGEYAEIPSLRDFVDGRFRYVRFAPSLPGTRPVERPEPGRAVGSPATPVAVYNAPPTTSAQPIPLSSLPSRTTASGGGRLLAIIGGASIAFIVALTLLAYFADRSRVSVQSSPRNAGSPSTSQVAVLAPAVTPTRVIARATESPRLSTPKPTTPSEEPQTPKPAATQPTTPPEEKNTPEPIAAQSPSQGTAQTMQPSAASGVSAAGAVAARSLRPACATPDAPARVVTLAPTQLSDQKRTESGGKSVVLTVDIGADGSVIGATVKESAGDVTLDFAALSAVRHSSYAPAERACTPVAGTADVTVSY